MIKLELLGERPDFEEHQSGLSVRRGAVFVCEEGGAVNATKFFNIPWTTGVSTDPFRQLIN